MCRMQGAYFLRPFRDNTFHYFIPHTYSEKRINPDLPPYVYVGYREEQEEWEYIRKVEVSRLLSTHSQYIYFVYIHVLIIDLRNMELGLCYGNESGASTAKASG